MNDKINKFNNLKINTNKDRSISITSNHFKRKDNSVKDDEDKKYVNYKKYLSREALFTRYNNETKTKILKGNRSLLYNLKNFNEGYEETIKNTHEEKRNSEQFHKLYEKLKRETEEYLKKKEGRSYEDLAFADLISSYKKMGYNIPYFTKNKNLFDPSPLLLPNEKISDYYSFVEKLNDMVDTKLKKNFYKDLNILHDLTNQVNSRISGQDSHKIVNIDKENNMLRLNKIRKEGTRIEMRNIKEHIRKLKTSFRDLNFLNSSRSDTLKEQKEDDGYYDEDKDKFVEDNYPRITSKHKTNLSGADVVFSLNKKSNKKIYLNSKNTNHITFNLNGNDLTNEAQSTYFDTKSTFNHSKTITQPFTLKTDEKIQGKKTKFNSSKMQKGLNIFSIHNENLQFNSNNPNFLKKLETFNRKFSRMSLLNSDLYQKNKFLFNNDSITNLETESSRSVVRKTKNEILKELYSKTSKEGDFIAEIKSYFKNYSGRIIHDEKNVSPHELIKNFNEIKSKISFLDFNSIFKNFLNQNGQLELNTDGLNKLKEYDDKILNSQIEFVKELNKKNI